MRVNMVELPKLDIIKDTKGENSCKKDVAKENSFENVLNERKNIEKPKEEKRDVTSEQVVENELVENIESEPSIVEAKSSSENIGDLEKDREITSEDVDALLVLLIAVTQNITDNPEIMNTEKLTNLVNDKAFVNGVKETLNQFVSKENFGKLDLEFLGEDNLLSKLNNEMHLDIPIKESFEKLIEQVKFSDVEVNSIKNQFDLAKVKDVIVKVLNEKGLSNEDIRELNMSLKIVKHSLVNHLNDIDPLNKIKTTEVLNDNLDSEKVNLSSQQTLDVENSKMNQGDTSDSSKESLNGKDTKSKEENFLSKLLTEDKSVFDLNIQRMKDFSNIPKVDSKVVINKESINMDIKSAVLNMTKVNMKEMIVKVNPGNLGEISIKLMAEADSMKAIIKVNAKETYALISAQDIKQHLSNENIRISDVEIELYKEDTTFFNESNEFMSKDEEKRNYSETSKNEFVEFEDDVEEEITLSSLDIII